MGDTCDGWKECNNCLRDGKDCQGFCGQHPTSIALYGRRPKDPALEAVDEALARDRKQPAFKLTWKQREAHYQQKARQDEAAFAQRVAKHKPSADAPTKQYSTFNRLSPAQALEAGKQAKARLLAADRAAAQARRAR